MPNYTEKALQNAIKDVGAGTSKRKAAERWGVPRSTLHARMNGVKPRHPGHQEEPQLLSEEQERSLVAWAKGQLAHGCYCLYSELEVCAANMAYGKYKPLEPEWIEGFLRRNPDAEGYLRREPEALWYEDQTMTSLGTGDFDGACIENLASLWPPGNAWGTQSYEHAT